MKKSFTFASHNKAPERNIDSIKFEVKKYITRERKKKLPEGTDYWDFDCKIGADESVSEKIDLKEIGKNIDNLFTEGHSGFYLEILAKAAYKSNVKETTKKK
ncbi:DUF6172 family protein [Halobacteriovorax sp. JY17]|uniref:DUF6172 family protein n=1 Tax=Halobacteriovorax sp. JY17 TaxID=2014617 RepID=UPI000C65C624|nr:DUF6172 family protein [Halobacteriovorax sp. JY17]PIK13580.1 MAG: hypothetical protein CES88_15430 [Halobacteriovorax sp. JY17]